MLKQMRVVDSVKFFIFKWNPRAKVVSDYAFSGADKINIDP